MTEILERPEQAVKEEPKAASFVRPHKLLGEKVYYWQQEMGRPMYPIPGVIVAKVPMSDEWILTVFLPQGGIVQRRIGKRSEEPKVGFWTLK